MEVLQVVNAFLLGASRCDGGRWVWCWQDGGG